MYLETGGGRRSVLLMVFVNKGFQEGGAPSLALTKRTEGGFPIFSHWAQRSSDWKKGGKTEKKERKRKGRERKEKTEGGFKTRPF